MLNKKELEDVLSQAKNAISKNRCFFGFDSGDLIQEFINLKVGDVQEIWPLVFELLHEMEPKHSCPPPKYLPAMKGKVFSFVWKSDKMRRTMHMQFAMHKDIFYYFALYASKK